MVDPESLDIFISDLESLEVSKGGPGLFASNHWRLAWHRVGDAVWGSFGAGREGAQLGYPPPPHGYASWNGN